MKTSVLGLSAAAAAALPGHVLLILAGGAAGLTLLLYLGIALPAVWSARPARRKAAMAVLRLILDALTRSRQVQTTSDALPLANTWRNHARGSSGQVRLRK